MALTPRVDLRQTQQLRMTPQLKQAIAMLQMTNLELSDYIRGEAEQNPLIEMDSEAEVAPVAQQDGPVSLDRELRDGLENGTSELNPGTSAYENVFSDSVSDLPFTADHTASALDFVSAQGPSLREDLRQQIAFKSAPDAVRSAALLLVEELNPDGLLDAPLFSIADQHGLGVADLEPGLTLLQSCEPVGIGARSIEECLRLQLAAKGKLTRTMVLLTENLPLLAKGHFNQLAKLTGLSQEELSEHVAQIQDLDPHPVMDADIPDAAAIVPDVIVSRDNDGGWKVELNTESLPRILINNDYAASLDAQSQDVRLFVSECRQKANWLSRAIEQRARTILAVAAQIVKHQSAFFETGPTALRPLTLRQIADEIDMHESTVSRVTANKYIESSVGTVPMRYFFTTAVKNQASEEAAAAAAIQARIKALISAESPKKILSDDKIVSILKEEGVTVARRTVAKYREGMSIPSSVLRRRQKAGSTGT